MTSLYNLTGELNELRNLVISGDASDQDISDTVEALEGEFENKALSVARFIQSIAPTVEGIDAEIKRLLARKKAIVSKEESLKDYLRDNMTACYIKRIDCDLFTILCKTASQTAHIEDESLLDDDYVNVKTVITPDKKKILKDLKEGVEVRGASISYGKAPIQIK